MKSSTEKIDAFALKKYLIDELLVGESGGIINADKNVFGLIIWIEVFAAALDL